MAHKNSAQFKNRLAAHAGGERVLHCVLCGSCTAGCPVCELDNSYDPRLMMRRILCGDGEQLLASRALWQCCQCHACVAHCPQNVRFADVLRALRELSVQDGHTSEHLVNEVAKLDEDARRARLLAVNNAFDKEATR